MKCLITQQETKSLTQGKPLSIEGRELLTQVLSAYNEKIVEQFVEKALGKAAENGSEKEEDDLIGTFKKLAPTISKGKMLRLIANKVPDALETIKEVVEG